MARRGRRGALAGATLLAALAAGGIAAPQLAPHDPYATALPDRLAPARASHPLGQDTLGRDVLARLLVGARISLAVGAAAVAISLVLGAGVGLAAGYAGGWIDEALARVIDVLLAFPGLLLAIALAAVLGPGLRNVVVALSALGWTGYARLARAEAAALRRREFVAAAEALGARPRRVIVRHLVPLAAPVLLVQATFGMAGAIVAEASLSFLGLGQQPPAPSWGSMLNTARNYVDQAPWMAVWPGLSIFLLVLSFNLLGDGLRDALDPRQK